VFDVGWSEMAVILLVALVVIGPRDLPRVARTMGKWVAKGRSMAREFQSALEDMAREAELDKVKSEIEKASRTDFGKTVENTIDPTGELGRAFDPTAKSGAKGTAGPGTPAAEAAKPEPPAEAAKPEPPAEAAKPEPPAEAAKPEPAEVAKADPEPAAPAGGEPAVAGAADLKPAGPKPTNGKAAALEPEPPAAGNGAASSPPARETAPADPS
jgi:sec-independent protein translocase protein TatB